jgi:hypothetical protein
MRTRRVAELSGGWQRLMLIARSGSTSRTRCSWTNPHQPPRSGQALPARAWLNSAARDIPVIVASHDRDFLDACTNRTLFLRPETSRFFALPYSEARRALEEEDAASETRLQRELKEAKQLRKQAAKLTNIGSTQAATS